MRRIIYLWIALAMPILALAQTTTGELVLNVTDGGENAQFVSVGLILEGAIVKTGHTDSLGTIKFRNLNPGKYDVRASYLGKEKVVKDVVVDADRATTVPINFELNEIEVEVKYVKPVIEPMTITTPIIKPGLSPSRGDIQRLMNMAPNVVSIDGGAASIGGSRPNSQRIYWNGVALNGSTLSNLPAGALQDVSIMLGGFSAEYGDFLGGAVTINTPRPGLQKHRSVELISSSLFDKYHNNYGELFFMGPLIVKNKGRDSAKVKLGYMLSSNFQYQADRSPSALGVWRVKPDKLKELEENPIRSSPIGRGYVPSAEFITQNDLEKVSANQNVPAINSSVLGELNFVPNDGMQILVGAKYDYNNVINYNFSNNLFNSGKNSQSISHNLLTYINLNQTIKTAEGSKIKSASYNVRLDYQGNWAVQQDPLHGANYFDYGYIGQFKTYSAPSFEFRENGENGNADTFTANGQTYYLKNYYRQTGSRPTDTLVTFDRTHTKNPLLANYTSLFYDLAGQENINSVTDIRSSSAGLVNGQNPIGIYSNMWNNVGLGVQGYGKSENQQMGINATGQVSTNTHDVRFGVYYEQRIQRGWSVTANSLWTLMEQLTNNGLTLDTDNPTLVFDENGIFKDTVRYGYTQTDKQSTFDKRLRAALIERGAVDNNGNPVTQNSFIDVHSLSPTDFSLSMFSADELLNNGNNYVNYYGYDYTGNKTRGTSSINGFTGDVLNRPVGAYMPSYAAAFVQDKVEFKGFTLRAGVRLERFDNNMPVLKDPFLLYDAHTAGEVKTLDGKEVEHPTSVGSNYVVYVDDARNPTKITGYRNGNTWYNAQGLQVADPAVIAEKSSGGTIQPHLVNSKQNRVEASAFTDYKPQIMMLPRLYFDFPIANNAARFFASYDVLAQRPGNNFATIAQYYYLPYNSTDVIGNPDLKPQRSTNFELGFRMKLSLNSALGLTASYREQRNLIQLYRYNYAYPVSYTSFANIDFSTIKSFTAQYVLRKRNVEMDVSYTLQFADGTGSSAGSQQALVAVGQPNLRTLFPLSFDVRNNIKFNVSYTTGSGKEYKGPAIKGVKLFENMGMVVNLNAFSGLPYTTNLLPTPEAQTGIPLRSPIKGTPYGARLPWQLQNDVSIYKNIPVSFSKNRVANRGGVLRFSLWVNNALNIKNIRGIHAYTGSSSSDGWLASAQGQKAIQDALNSQAYVDLYNTALANPGFYTMPRRVRLGVSLTF